MFHLTDDELYANIVITRRLYRWIHNEDYDDSSNAASVLEFHNLQRLVDKCRITEQQILHLEMQDESAKRIRLD